ncbi:MAG: protein-L-isoaspartate(D-aspartate) O-methyltransferase [Planctomycetota bacterium]|jgi:protein-L-isoaspartate(D-aspartate) O-methyltransferase
MSDAYDERFDFEGQRSRMVEVDLKGRDISDPLVLQAFARVPRHCFVDPGLYPQAYADHPLSIGCGQTISQPYIVALMTQLLAPEPGLRVLEVGTGSGYQTAILAALGLDVVTIERHEPLTERACQLLEKLDLDGRVEFLVGDGSLGAPEEEPFDRILVTAAAPQVPPALKDQLSPGGRMVIPVGTSSQHLLILRREGDTFRQETHIPVLFVPLIGEEGFSR